MPCPRPLPLPALAPLRAPRAGKPGQGRGKVCRAGTEPHRAAQRQACRAVPASVPVAVPGVPVAVPDVPVAVPRRQACRSCRAAPRRTGPHTKRPRVPQVPRVTHNVPGTATSGKRCEQRRCRTCREACRAMCREHAALAASTRCLPCRRQGACRCRSPCRCRAVPANVPCLRGKPADAGTTERPLSRSMSVGMSECRSEGFVGYP